MQMFEPVTSPLGTTASFDEGCQLFNTHVRLLSYDWDSRMYKIQLEQNQFKKVPLSTIKLHPGTRCMLLTAEYYGYCGVVHTDLEDNKYKVFVVGKYIYLDIPYSKVVSLE